MIELSDLRFLRNLAHAPSMAAVARSMNITPSAVTQKLKQLEKRMGLKLVQRGRSGILLTPDGQHLLELGDDLLLRADTLKESVLERQGRVAGPLRIIAPAGFGRIVVAPIISSFCVAHPDLEPSLTLSDNPISIMRATTWDVIIHIGRLPDMEIIQRQIASNRRILVAAPAYLDRHGLPGSPQDLDQHRLGVVRESNDDPCIWSLQNENGDRAVIRVSPGFSCNDGEVIRAWAHAGMGIVERSEWSVAGAIRAGDLIHILPQWSLPNADIVTLLNPKTTRSVRVDAFVSALSRSIRTQIQQIAG